LRSRINGEFKFALLAVVNGKSFEEEGAKSRASTTSERVEDEETL
jgi:hypothetical protein